MTYGAPVGFLLIEKAMMLFFGIHEYVLRLFPLLVGILSLILLYVISRRILSTQIVPIVVAFFSFSSSVLLHTSVMKQYSGDVFWAMLLFWIACILRERRFTSTFLLLWAICGVLAILTSYPSVFVLAGYGCTLIALEWRDGNRRNAARLIAVACGWLAIFAVNYLLSVSALSSDEFLLTCWRNGFLPRPFLSVNSAIWLLRTPFRVFRDSNIGLWPWWLNLFGFGLGCIWLFSRSRRIFLLLLTPMPFALIASILQKYPYSGRMILFLEPACMITVAAGLELIWHIRAPATSILALAIAVVLLIGPAGNAARTFLNPYDWDETRPLLDYILEYGKIGDDIYVYYGSSNAFEFYHAYDKKYAFEGMAIHMGIARTADISEYQHDLETLAGKHRVWIILSKTWIPEDATSNPERGFNEEMVFRSILERTGRCQEHVKIGRASLWLYDLSK